MHPTFTQPRVLPRCKRAPVRAARGFPSDYNGWLAYTAYQTQAPLATFDAFLGNFSVPNEPARKPRVLYIFTGLQNINWVPKVDPNPSGPFDIIQYPKDDTFGWGVKSWFVSLDIGAVWSTEISAKPDDIIYGNMTRTSGNTWFIGGVNTRTKQATTITVSHARLQLQPWAYTTVECYGCQSCEYLPTNTLHFTGMSLVSKGLQVTPSWTAYTSPNNICNTKAALLPSPAAVDYTFQ